MKKQFIFYILLFLSSYLSAQTISYDTPITKLQRSLVFKLQTKQLKDSIAFYSFAFKVDVNLVKDSTQITSVTVNDSIAYTVYSNFDFLKEINYASFISAGKRATIIIPVGIIVVNHDFLPSDARQMKIEGLTKNLNKLFDYNELNNDQIPKYIFLAPCIISTNKAIYD